MNTWRVILIGAGLDLVVILGGGLRPGAAAPAPAASTPRGAAPAVDDLVDQICGSEPSERKLRLRLEQARLEGKAVTATTKCYDLRAKAAARGELKWVRGFDADAELSWRRCLEDRDVHDPAVIALLTDYVRAALQPDAGDQRRTQDYDACYRNVLNCRQHPCPKAAAPRRSVAAAAGALTLSVKLLAADRADGAFLPVAAGTALRTGQQVKFDVSTSRRAYLYILQRSASGALTVLFPDAAIRANNPLPAGALQFPPGDSFTLDGAVGREALIVVASEHEPIGLVTSLTSSHGGAAGAVEEALRMLEAGAPPEANPAAPVDGEDRATRGLVLSSRVARSGDDHLAPAFTARAAPGDDTVVAYLGFLHVANGRP